VIELFIHHKASPFVRKPLLAIAELGLAVEEKPIDMMSAAAMDDYATLNPNRRFPTLRDGELVLWESLAILRYLARGTPWVGADATAAALVDQWLAWELAHLGPALLGLQNLRLGFSPKPPRDEPALVADATRLLAILDGALATRSYVAGAITIADLSIAADLTFADEAKLLPGEHANVTRWFAAIRERASWQLSDRWKRETLAAFGISF
jgi:glutathione S-transferase